VRISLLSVCLGLAAYTVFFAGKLAPGHEGEALAHGLRYRADLLAARTEAALAGPRTALRAGADLWAEHPDRPLDVAESVVAQGGGDVLAAAVVGQDGHVDAMAGKTDGLKFDGAGGGVALWSDGRRLYLAQPVDGGRLVAALAAPRLEASPGQVLMLAAPDGRVLAASDPAPKGDLAALGMEAAHAAAARRTAVDVTAEGAALKGAVAAGSRDGFVVLAAAPPPAPDPLSVLARLLPLIVPLGLGAFMMVLVWSQARRAEAAQRVYADTERRFRTAVEAARCGIWEWDLERDEVYLSDNMAVMLGWPAGGIVRGDEMLSRVAPDHRDGGLRRLRGGLPRPEPRGPRRVDRRPRPRPGRAR
jgi:two-component system cell cycle sensor histidine kinase PleC